MPIALFVLVGCQLVGEILRDTLRVPLPGPLIGMFLLAAVLALDRRGAAAATGEAASPLLTTANALISNMGLLFVPAGVGVIVEIGVLRREWIPILAGLLVSTILGLVVTGLVMNHVTRFVETRKPRLPEPVALREAR